MVHIRRTRSGVSAPVLIAIALVATPVVPRPASAQSPDDVYWSGSFDVPAFDAEVQDLVVWSGSLFAGGTFGQTPDGPAAGIARWDGEQWHALGAGVNGGVWALADGGGLLIVGGAFTSAGGVAANNVAAWNGIEWLPLGSGLAGQVLDLSVVDGQLYAAGDFTFGAAFEHVPVARWNGTDWVPFGPLVPSATFARAHEIAEFSGALVAGGRFRQEGVTAAGLVLRWTGSAWDTLASGTGTVLSLVADGSTLVAGGVFSFDQGAESPIARWDGVAWSTVLPAVTGTAHELAVLSTGLHVGGLLTAGTDRLAVARVTATGLETFPWLTGTTFALAEFGGQLFAGGSITAADFFGRQEPLFHCARLGNPSWETVGGAGRDGYGLMGLPFRGVHAMLPVGGDLYVGGSFSVARNGSRWETTGIVASWSGSAWTGYPDLAGTVYTLAWYDNQLVAGGNFTGPSGIRNLATWNGVEWTSVGGGTDDEVLALAVSGADLYVGGRFQSAGGVLAPGVARWDGYSWSAVGNLDLASPAPVVRALLSWSTVGDPDLASPTPIVCGLLPSGPSLIAAGTFTSIGGVPADNVARWNGTDWTSLGAGYPGEAFALVKHDGRLIVGGYPLVGTAASPVLRWTGTWEPLGSRGGPGVQCLLVANGVLHAGGDFVDLGTPGVDIVAQWWGGGYWGPLGSGLGQRTFDYRVVHSMAEFEGSLYVAGGLNSAGGKPSSLIARWDGLPGPGPAPAGLLSVAPGRPNPFAAQTTLEYTLGPAQASCTQCAEVTIQVHDLNGRLVRTLVGGRGGLGRYAAVWDGRDKDQRRLPAGVYWVRFVPGEGEAVSRKVVLLP